MEQEENNQRENWASTIQSIFSDILIVILVIVIIKGCNGTL